MDLKLVPIPCDNARATEQVWRPFLEQIAVRSRCHLGHFLDEVISGETHLLIAWDADAKRALALAGMRVKLRGDDDIAELVWCTGSGRQLWQHLLADIETYSREHLGCAGFRAIARPGWSPLLKSRGYRVSHLVMEKDFDHG